MASRKVVPMNEYQEAFIKAMEKEASFNPGFPYEKFVSLFKDSSFSLGNLYEAFCLGYDAGQKSSNEK